MSERPLRARCPLCGACSEIVSARFHQVYSQKDSAPVLLDWWECHACRGWFVHPVPTPETIKPHWGTVAYNDPKLRIEIAQAKDMLHQRIIAGLSRWTEPGPLLDFGCNFGQFLLVAREAGWIPIGFEPYETAAETARENGFDVRCNWSLKEAGFTEGYFAAITAIDSFYYVWDPIATLATFHHLLKFGGVLAMRLTNKRFILGLARFLSAGPERDARISRILQGQYHSISLRSLTRIIRAVGFDRIRIQPHAVTAPWSALERKTRIAYLGASAVYVLSLTKINLSPGVLLFARNGIS